MHDPPCIESQSHRGEATHSSIPTVDIESGIGTVIYSCTGTVLACRILLASTAWGAHLQLYRYRYRTSRMRAPA